MPSQQGVRYSIRALGFSVELQVCFVGASLLERCVQKRAAIALSALLCAVPCIHTFCDGPDVTFSAESRYVRLVLPNLQTPQH